MTIAIGFTCQNSLVVASDSQISDGGSTFQQWGENKIVEIRFKDGTAALLAKSGSIDVGNVFQEAFQAEASSTEAKHPRHVASVAEQNLKATRDKLLGAYYHETFEPGSSKRYMDSLYSKFLLAYYYDEKPYIYTLELESAFAAPSNSQFTAIGCAANLATYILSGIDLSSKSFGSCFGLAYYAIEMCKKHDQACGGMTQMRTVDKKNQVCAFTEQMSRHCTEAALAFENKRIQSLDDELLESWVRTLIAEYGKNGLSPDDVTSSILSTVTRHQSG